MQKNKTKMTPEYKAELWDAFSWVAMIKVAFDWFFPQHASLAIFLADSICVILFGIIAIVYANKANPPAKKWKNWGDCKYCDRAYTSILPHHCFRSYS